MSPTLRPYAERLGSTGAMSNIYQVAFDYRRRLLAHDADAAITLVQAYRQAQARLDGQMDALARQIAAQQAAGETVTRGRLLRMERYRELERQILDEVRRLTAMAEGVISGGQALAVDLGAEAALQTALLSAGVGVVWNRLPTRAFEQLVGALSDGSPLRDLLDELPEATARNVRDRLLQGLALGYNPRKIAALGRNELGLTEQRLLTISRTEIPRAYRAATLETYRANSHLIEGGRWLAAKSFRTCPACLAMDGKVFELEIEPGMHPNCRCTMVPVLIGRELPARQTAAEWLAKQEDADQERVLGKGRHALYKAGEIGPDDWWKWRESDRWGRSVQVKPLRELRRAA